MNNFSITGNLTRDPHTKEVGDKTICEFGVAVPHPYKKDQVSFVECGAWDKRGEFVQKFFTKGKSIAVTGPFVQRRWDDKDGNSRNAWQLEPNTIEFNGPKQTDSQEPAF